MSVDIWSSVADGSCASTEPRLDSVCISYSSCSKSSRLGMYVHEGGKEGRIQPIRGLWHWRVAMAVRTDVFLYCKILKPCKRFNCRNDF